VEDNVTTVWYAGPTGVTYRHRRLSTNRDNGQRSPPTYTNGGQNRR
jgi:hypothetical protein